ncbi:helix-turn-helix domain-containing protein [Vibrio sp. Sgm 22]|uniref:winged helix-turn-helix domain-containing protein n=1 Tax=unclassified Vibrio TaxID=2614977 RepID=UPI00224994EF|nr:MULTISPECIES: helix-turn-helix domain-containing protein [unclassified Vibrio]MCX2761134.1 helix-turn-helix domain-containing protein [Vibrio sp. 14G-20]MCX2778071.1 helix-turn-helix domain-containing protein [Vibrio sp. Sgm 22]
MNFTTNSMLSSTSSKDSQTNIFKENNKNSNSANPIDKHSALKNEVSDNLNEVEVKILSILMRNSGNVVTRSELIENSWGGRVVTGSSLNVAIKKIRDASKNTPLEGKIVTLPKKGYMFTKDDYTQSISDTTIVDCNIDISSNTINEISSEFDQVTIKTNYWVILLSFITNQKKFIINLISLVLWQTSFIGFIFLWWPE